MQTLKFMSIVFTILVAVTTAFADEDLFDTATATLHFEKGISHLKAKKYDAAINELEEAVSIYPNAENYYFLGYAYYLKGRSGHIESRKSSMENFERAYELNPQFAPGKLISENDISPAHGMEAGAGDASQPLSGEKPPDGPKTAGGQTTSE